MGGESILYKWTAQSSKCWLHSIHLLLTTEVRNMDGTEDYETLGNIEITPFFAFVELLIVLRPIFNITCCCTQQPHYITASHIIKHFKIKTSMTLYKHMDPLVWQKAPSFWLWTVPREGPSCFSGLGLGFRGLGFRVTRASHRFLMLNISQPINFLIVLKFCQSLECHKDLYNGFCFSNLCVSFS